MAEEKEKSQPLVGVMVGLMRDVDGKKFIALDILGGRLAMTMGAAAVVFNQIGDLLDDMGYFDEIEIEGSESGGVKKCKLH